MSLWQKHLKLYQELVCLGLLDH